MSRALGLAAYEARLAPAWAPVGERIGVRALHGGGAARPRPQHLAWVGTTLRADDPWWGTHYPPNGWRCKCGVRPVSEPGLRRMGKSGPDEAPAIEREAWRNPRTGAIEMVPKGISPGFDYNVGEAWQKGGGMPPSTPVPPSPLSPPPSPLSPPPVPRASPAPPASPPVSAPERMPTIEPAPTPPSPMPPPLPPEPAMPAPARIVLAPPGTDAVAPEVLQAFLSAPAGNVQVGALADDALRQIEGDVPAVLLSAETLIKQRGNHRKETPEWLYGAALQHLLATPEAVLENRPRAARLLGRVGDVPLTAVVKRTIANTETYLLSYHPVRLETVMEMLEKHPVVAGSVDDFVRWLRERAR